MCILKKIRKELELKQNELIVEGISRSDISKLENGTREMKYQLAIKLSNKINLVMCENNLTLPYNVTPELLCDMKKVDINKVISNLEKNVDNDTINAISESIKKLTTTEECTSFLFECLEILNRDISRNKMHIITFSIELMRYQLSDNDYIKAKMYYIRALFNNGDFEGVIKHSLTIAAEIKGFDHDLQVRFLYNLAIAYYKIREIKKAKEVLKSAKLFKIKAYECHLLMVDASIEDYLGNYEKAIEIYKEMHKKSKDIEFKANCLSNIADGYYKLKDIKNFKKYIEKAMTFFNDVNLTYQYNMLSRLFVCRLITKSDYSDIITKLAEIIKELNNEHEFNMLIDNVVNNMLKDTCTLKKVLIYLLGNCKLSADNMSNLLSIFQTDMDIIGLLINNNLIKGGTNYEKDLCNNGSNIGNWRGSGL